MVDIQPFAEPQLMKMWNFSHCGSWIQKHILQEFVPSWCEKVPVDHHISLAIFKRAAHDLWLPQEFEGWMYCVELFDVSATRPWEATSVVSAMSKQPLLLSYWKKVKKNRNLFSKRSPISKLDKWTQTYDFLSARWSQNLPKRRIKSRVYSQCRRRYKS